MPLIRFVCVSCQIWHSSKCNENKNLNKQTWTRKKKKKKTDDWNTRGLSYKFILEKSSYVLFTGNYLNWSEYGEITFRRVFLLPFIGTILLLFFFFEFFYFYSNCLPFSERFFMCVQFKDVIRVTVKSVSKEISVSVWRYHWLKPKHATVFG